MSKEAMKLALGKIKSARECHPNAVDALLFEAEEILEEALAEQPAQQEPLYHLRQFGDVTKEQLERYMATGDINQRPAQQEPVDSAQISKVWWDGEKLIAKPIPFVEFYKPAQRTWVGLTHEEHMEIMTGMMTTSSRMAAVEAKLKEKNT